jgi:hypothetical protein
MTIRLLVDPLQPPSIHHASRSGAPAGDQADGTFMVRADRRRADHQAAQLDDDADRDRGVQRINLMRKRACATEDRLRQPEAEVRSALGLALVTDPKEAVATPAR